MPDLDGLDFSILPEWFYKFEELLNQHGIPQFCSKNKPSDGVEELFEDEWTIKFFTKI